MSRTRLFKTLQRPGLRRRALLGFARRAFAVGALVAFLVVGCRPARTTMHPQAPAGYWYELRPGETLAQVAERAGVPLEDIAELNGIDDPAEVSPGRLVFIPDGRVAPAAPREIPPGFYPPGEDGPRPGPPVQTAARLRWPLEAPMMTSPFAVREGRPHEGIDLAAPLGTPVFAAAAGEVVYAGDGIRGYGNLVVIKHPGNLMTVYAHNSALLVSAGDQVVDGQTIAKVGKTGRATAPHLHFEVREGEVPRDPVHFLPPLTR